MWDVIVIGGGPAGMMAGGRAAELGRSVLLLEKNSILGKKLLITGGGRCNVTNNKPEIRTMLEKYEGNDKFLFSAFSQFDVEDTLKFFNQRGMATKEEAEGRVFPVSNKAQSVWDVLVRYMKEGGVQIQTSAAVTSLSLDIATRHNRALLLPGALHARKPAQPERGFCGLKKSATRSSITILRSYPSRSKMRGQNK